ncbi:hypothetical protein FGB62_146g04 [Gracilaria domingensis]|nr:hypothetical protein FGB62_146g04 [Gracilaria domingensis]
MASVRAACSPMPELAPVMMMVLPPCGGTSFSVNGIAAAVRGRWWRRRSERHVLLAVALRVRRLASVR